MRKTSYSLILFLLLTSSTLTHAGVKEGLRSLYLSSVTSPQAIDTLRSRGFYFGQLSLRPMSTNVTLIQFAPPRISMGCGKVDLFFGAFSFISGQQFEQLIRGIIAAAPGFLLEAAIKQMCNQCGDIMDKLRNLVNRINGLMRNSCEIAASLFGPPDSRESAQESLKNKWKGVQTAFSDVVDAVAGTVKADASPPPQPTVSGGGDKVQQNATPSDVPRGDLACQALLAKRQEVARIGSFIGLGETDTINLIVSLVGTKFYNTAESQQNQGAQCPAGAPQSACAGPPPLYLAPTINGYKAFLEPTSKELVYLTTASQCQTVPTPITVSTSSPNWAGLNQYLEDIFFGSSPLDANGKAASGNIVHSILYNGGSGMHPNAQELLSRFGGNLPEIIRVAQSVAGDGFATIAADHYIKYFMRPAIEYYIVGELDRLVTRTFSSKDDKVYNRPEVITEMLGTIATLNKEARELLAKNDTRTMLEASNLVTQAIYYQSAVRSATQVKKR
jgi:conjugative transfer pilus assembly protein TraH